jgi:hypothetical protein
MTLQRCVPSGVPLTEKFNEWDNDITSVGRFAVRVLVVILFVVLLVWTSQFDHLFDVIQSVLDRKVL